MRLIVIAYGVLFISYLIARLALGERWSLVALANVLLPWLCTAGIVLGIIGLLYPGPLAAGRAPTVRPAGFRRDLWDLLLPAKPVPAASGRADGHASMSTAEGPISSA